MASVDQVKATILDIAGNPTSGVIAEYADAWANAIVALDETPANSVTKEANRVGMVEDGTQFGRLEKETRITKPAETR